MLDRVPVVPGDPVHVVAPPGSGKTLLGLLLAGRAGARALVLAPTATIRSQWAASAAALDGAPAVRVSEDPEHPGDLTALTYQMLSVLETGNPAHRARGRGLAPRTRRGRPRRAGCGSVARRPRWLQPDGVPEGDRAALTGHPPSTRPRGPGAPRDRAAPERPGPGRPARRARRRHHRARRVPPPARPLGPRGRMPRRTHPAGRP
ncbi:hypothetical protein Q9Q99_03975 [Curtobacterium flaccumfaciens]|nr:hypothetical protein Q9Q99_03975 [Curtobacterium flaccumfaciens]